MSAHRQPDRLPHLDPDRSVATNGASSSHGASHRILLSAFGIHVGGGRVLLDTLVVAMCRALKGAAFDARFKLPSGCGSLSCEPDAVPRSFRARAAALDRLARQTGPDDVLFCFNGLPPLRSVQGRVVLFVHASYFAGLHRGIRYSPMTALRIGLERLWFAAGVRHCDEIWVQTRSMQEAMAQRYPSVSVRVLPFVEPGLLAKLRLMHTDPPVPRAVADSDFRFFYPADPVGHKNHLNLLRAWALLAAQGRWPRLVLTLKPGELEGLYACLGPGTVPLDNVENIGWLPHEQVLGEMSRSSALVFPSLTESFGIPLLEARSAGVPIIASERDFVRDVCRPHETFDPLSPHSLASALLRFMDGQSEVAYTFYSAAELVEELLS